MTQHKIDKITRLAVIINPAAGQNEPILNQINDAMRAVEVEWKVYVTQPEHEPGELADQALADGAQALAVYGGDGTINQVAQSVIHADVPLCVLSGGSGNAFAKTLELPADLQEAIGLCLVDEPSVRAIDVCKLDEDVFLLAAGAGLYGDVLNTADRDLKDQYGWLAYLIGGVKSVSEAEPAQYHLTVDGEAFTQSALACIVSNVNRLGVLGLSLPEVALDDGLLDAFLIDSSIKTLSAGTGILLGVEDLAQSIHHWRGEEIVVRAEPEQAFFLDGEDDPLYETPARFSVVPGALHVITG